MKKLTFAIIRCRHPHIMDFVKEMTDLGHHCLGIYEPHHLRLRSILVDKFDLPVWDNIDQLLAEKPDIVGCASVNKEKIDMIELCERHCIHVMVDKPVVTCADGYQRLEAIIKRKKIQIGLMLTERFEPVFYTLKSIIDSEGLGEITHISMRKPHRLSRQGREPWFFSKEQSGGIIVDLLSHDFDLLRWLTGKTVREINGFMTKNILPEYPDFYDTASLSVLLNDDLPVQLYADWHTPNASWTWGDGRVFITGTKGCAELRLQGDPFVAKDSLFFYLNHDQAIERIELKLPPMKLTEDFIQRINGGPCVISHQDILNTAKDTLAADRRVQRIKTV